MLASALRTTALLAVCALALPAHAQDTHVMTDGMGSVEVPVDPQRIVVTDGDSVLQPTIALGIVPVGASRPNFTGGLSRWIADKVPDDMGNIGSSTEPNFEEVLLMEPDLILMSDDDLPDLPGFYERYSAIAPTLLVETDPVHWKDMVHTIAEATGRQAEAAKLFSDYDARVAEVRSAIAGKIGTASVVRVRTDHVRYMLQDASFTWSVLKEVGFKAPPQQETSSGDAFINISLERLDLLDADLILLLEDTGATGPGAMNEQLAQLPAFAELKGERLVLPSADYLFGNILTAFALLDVIEAHYAQ